MRVALVTGAAGGVGRATVQGLREQGFRIVAEDISPEVESLAADDVAVVRGDCAEAATATSAVSTALDRFGRLDVLVNNAAVFLRRPLTEVTDEEWDLVMRVNVRGAFVHCRAAMPALIEHSGAVVNVASISGVVGMDQQVAYTASKGALIQLTRSLAVEFGPSGVRVNAVVPGTIDTGFIANSLSGVPDSAEDFGRDYPLGRIIQPEEVSSAVVFLSGDGASAITGSLLTVDGGYTAK